MESFMEVFNEAKKIIKEKISHPAYDVWIKPIEPMRLENDKAYLFIKSEFQKKIITEKYKKLLEDSFEQVLTFPISVVIYSDENVNSSECATPDELNEKINDELGNKLIDKVISESEYEYTFDTFIVSATNSFAYSACKAISKGKNSDDYNPLFIYGDSGLGKTHLLMAIKHAILKENPDFNVLYITGEQFTNELVLSLQNNMLSSFKEKFRNVDILLADDIQFLSGKDYAQEEFFHTFNSLHQLSKQIVITSDRPPKDIKSIKDRVLSRFEWGIITDVTIPDFETRVAIVKRKSELLDIEIPNEIIEYICNRLKTNIRQLEGTVKKIKAYKLLTNSHPSISMAQDVVKNILKENQPISVTVEKILGEISHTYGISISVLRSRNRSAQVSLARQTAIYIIKEVTGMTLDMIGEEFGGRDHATILYALQKVEKALEENFHYKELINDIIKNIKGSIV